MSKNRYLDTKFWADSYVEKLDPVEKLLFIYLMTNERTNLSGVFELPIKYMSVETGIEISMLRNILERFERDGKIVLYNGWVRVVNAIKHQNLNNVKIRLGIQKLLEDIPDDVQQGLKMSLDESSMSLDESSHLIESNNNLIELNNNIIQKNADATVSEKSFEDADAYRLARKLHDSIKERYNFTKERPTEVPRSYDSIEKLHRIDGFDYAIIEQVLDWSQQDEFWQQNILSGEKLRKQFQRLLITIKSKHDSQSSRLVIAGQ